MIRVYDLTMVFVKTTVKVRYTYDILAGAAPTFAACACGVMLLSTSTSTPLAPWWWSLAATCAGGVFPSAIGANTPWTSGGHPLKLALVVFFLPPTGAQTPLAPAQLALCGGGLWWW